MKIIITEKQLETIKSLISEQNFYPKGCRPIGGILDDPNIGWVNERSKKVFNKSYIYSQEKNTYDKNIRYFQKKEQTDKEFRLAKRDVMATMDNTSEYLFRQLKRSEHPFYYGIVAKFASSAKSAVLGTYQYTSQMPDVKVLKNWVTNIRKVGENDYQVDFRYAVLKKTPTPYRLDVPLNIGPNAVPDKYPTGPGW